MLGIYCRISKDRKKQVSIAVQKAHGVEFADSQSPPLKYEVYIDKGISGRGSIDKRPEYSRMMNDIRSGRIDSLYIYERSRNDRNISTWVSLAEELKEKSIPLYIKGKYKDLNDNDTYYQLVQYAVYDQKFADETSEKIQDALKENVKNGKAFSINPYGYKTGEGSLLVLDEIETKVVQRMYEMSLSGKGTDKIAELLNIEGVETRRGARWHGKTVQDIINNPIHKGLRRWGDSFYEAPASMSVEYWQKVQNNFKNNANTRGRKESYNYLLKHILKCGYCERNYYGRIRKDKEGNYTDYYYQCSSRRRGYETCGNKGVNIGKIENLVWAKFIEEGKLLGIIQDHFKTNATSNKVDELRSQIVRIDNELSDNKRRLNNLLEAVAEKTLKKHQIAPKSEAIEVKRNQLEIERIRILEQIDGYTSLDKISQIETELNNFTNISFNDKRTILKKYIHHIDIWYLEKGYHDKPAYTLHLHFNIRDLGWHSMHISRDFKEIETTMVSTGKTWEELVEDTKKYWESRGEIDPNEEF